MEPGAPQVPELGRQTCPSERSVLHALLVSLSSLAAGRPSLPSAPGIAIPSSPSVREVSPHSRGLLGSSPQAGSEAGSRPPSAVSNGRSPGGRPPYYMHRTSRSMQDLEAVWVENQQAYPMYQVSPNHGPQPGGSWSVEEEGGHMGADEGAHSPEDDTRSHASGTGYFMPTYRKPKKSKSKTQAIIPKPANSP
jgi:hypothetical protein